jgi:hypothetical protein
LPVLRYDSIHSCRSSSGQVNSQRS